MTRCTKPALPAPLRNLPPLTLLSRLVPASRRGTARTHNRMPSKVRENYRRATTCCEQACGGRRGETRRERGTVQQSPRVSTPHAEAIRSGSVRFMGVGSGARVRAGWIGEKKGQNPERTMNVCRSAGFGFPITPKISRRVRRSPLRTWSVAPSLCGHHPRPRRPSPFALNIPTTCISHASRPRYDVLGDSPVPTAIAHRHPHSQSCSTSPHGSVMLS
jgi:hypothetical protein